MGSALSPTRGAYDVLLAPLIGWGGDTLPISLPLIVFGASDICFSV